MHPQYIDANRFERQLGTTYLGFSLSPRGLQQVLRESIDALKD